MARLDPHSYFDDTQARVRALDWHVTVDFDRRVLRGSAALHFVTPTAAHGPLDLDTRDLRIHAVATLDGRPVAFSLDPADAVLGARLRLDVPAEATGVRLTYETSPEASALQWLTPRQTDGGRHPFLFSQCQAIHARSVLPVQDTPRVRITYTAEVFVPAPLRVLMAAAFDGREVRGEVAIERWHMPQPIPPYLFAFAVGELESRELGPRSRVWAEPGVVERAAAEFADVDAMLLAAEGLFGPYPWDRFDVLTMPPSFPYGGMENPRLTFVTPTLLAGDRSLVNVVAHELAHSWTGNLVTNADAEHFWLNEGFTVYAERRIQERLEGFEITALHAALGRAALDEAIAEFGDQPALTHLRTHLWEVDPDQAYSVVPYEKGYLFLVTLEAHLGRPAFDALLRRYIETFGFQSITTDDFTAFMQQHAPGALAAVHAKAWIDGPGVPENAPAPRSVRLDRLRALGATLPEPGVAAAWTPAEWQLYLQGLLDAAAVAPCEALDARWRLTDSRNYEVLVAWLELGLRAGYAPAVDRTVAVLGEVGRMKYLKPLYRALSAHPETKAVARATFERNAAGYHPIARQVIAGLLGVAP
jgi:leukotriene A-4 hydrolase/aminopeptidase